MIWLLMVKSDITVGLADTQQKLLIQVFETFHTRFLDACRSQGHIQKSLIFFFSFFSFFPFIFSESSQIDELQNRFLRVPLGSLGFLRVSFDFQSSFGIVGVPQGSSGFLKVPQGSLGFFRFPQGVLEFLGVPQGSLGFFRVLQVSLGCLRVPWGFLGFLRVLQGFLGSLKILQGLLGI